MSAQVVTRKRKSADGSTTVSKKVKMTKSADKPAPLKSALKKSEVVAATQVTKSATKRTKKPEKAPPSKKAKSAETEGTTAEATEPVANEAKQLTAAETADLLAGFSSSEDESSDDEGNGIALSSLPKVPVTGKLRKQLEATSGTADPEATPGVLYLSRVPHGFFETQMRAYFSQFGEITHLRLVRNHKTGASRHFAFIEFASSAVADIVVKTMDKYLLFGHILQARRVPPDQVQPEFWKAGKGTKRGSKVKPKNRLEAARLRKGMAREEWGKRVEKESRRREEKAEKMREMGYEFEMPKVKGVDAVPVQEKMGEVPAVEEDAQGGASLLEDGLENAVAEPPVENLESTVAKNGTASDKKRAKKAAKA